MGRILGHIKRVSSIDRAKPARGRNGTSGRVSRGIEEIEMDPNVLSRLGADYQR